MSLLCQDANVNVQTAAAKGLVAGSFRIVRQDGHIIDGRKEKEGLLIPKIGEHDVLDLASIQWILVIEKEVRKGTKKQRITR